MNTQLSGRFDPSIPTRIAAFRSWQSIKTPVMIWLWYLNILYWVGFFYLARPEAFWALLSYFAVGPLVFIMITRQRGLTRLSGLIHLPWAVFLIYLGLRLFTDALGPAISAGDDLAYFSWLQVVFWSTLICVVLDVVDVMRWFAGARYVLGTPAAVAAKASKLGRAN